MKITHLYLGIALVLGFAMPTLGQQSIPTQKLDSLLEILLIPEVPGGGVLIAKNDQIVFERYFGFANLEYASKTNEKSLFRIGSLTKQFTAVAILKLVQDDKLSLVDSIAQFFPDSPEHFHSVTIKQLLNHTSGIKNITELPQWKSEIESSKLSIDEIINLIWKQEPYFKPGTDFHYSNSNYVVLGKIIESASDMDYSSFLDQHLFEPLEMKHSFCDHQKEIIPFRVSGYKKISSRLENAAFINMNLPFGAGGLLMNLRDFWIWDKALNSGAIIPISLLDQAQSPTLTTSGKKIGYGFGWSIGDLQSHRTIKHSGYINGFSSFAISIPDQSVHLMIFTNLENYWDLEKTASILLAEMIGKSFVVKSPTQVSIASLANKVGDYRNENQETLRIILQEGNLYSCIPGGSKSRLIPIDHHIFQLENSLTRLQFDEDSSDSFTYKDLGIPASFEKNHAVPSGNWIYNTLSLGETQIKEYLGSYQFENGPEFKILREGDKFYGSVGSDKKEIIPYKKDHFFAKDLDAELRFYRDEKNKIIGLIKIQGGGEMKAPRISN